jgi:hypothetical protein
MKSKPLYSTYSFSNFARSLALKIICIAAIIYLIIHFNENRVVIGVCIAFALLLLVASGTDYILIYPDHFEIRSDALINISRDKKSFNYREVALITGEPKPTASEAVAYILLRPFIKSGNTNSRKLFVQLKNGQELQYDLDISSQELLKVITMINSRLRK